ncbi:Hypothetical predicted protein [Olea europaea subsp. europaea]|uniref:PGG domain-containing protein n=1 Tax=Olea europaea subsp. europaea TaxID=158383 RepID=A0A8S0U5B5_OLEEU|nr:Hypothetical predicted protein [Olea europaea subsp. europaea]
MDVLIRSRTDLRDEEIEESLKHAGAFGSTENNSLVQINHSITSPGLNLSFAHRDMSLNVKKNSRETMFEQRDGWLEKKRSALMVVASLIATMAFQVRVNPPYGIRPVGPDDSPPSASDSFVSIFDGRDRARCDMFLIANTIGLIASLSIILLLMSGLPIRRRRFMWILMVTTWIAITAVALIYFISIDALIPQDKPILVLIYSAGLIWFYLMVFLLLGHVIKRMVHKLINCLSSKERIQGSRITSHSTV